MDTVLSQQVKAQQAISAKMAWARRRWNKHFSWFPVKQNELYLEVERIYKETREKYGEEFFKSYARERRLNSRMYSDDHLHDVNYSKFEKLRKHMDESGELPLLYYYEHCGKKKPCSNI